MEVLVHMIFCYLGSHPWKLDPLIYFTGVEKIPPKINLINLFQVSYFFFDFVKVSFLYLQQKKHVQ